MVAVRCRVSNTLALNQHFALENVAQQFAYITDITYSAIMSAQVAYIRNEQRPLTSHLMYTASFEKERKYR